MDIPCMGFKVFLCYNVKFIAEILLKIKEILLKYIYACRNIFKYITKYTELHVLFGSPYQNLVTIYVTYVCIYMLCYAYMLCYIIYVYMLCIIPMPTVIILRREKVIVNL